MMSVSFEQAANNRVAAIPRAIYLDLPILLSLKGFCDSSEAVERSEFESFSRPLLTLTPSVRAVEGIPRVSRANPPWRIVLHSTPEFPPLRKSAQPCEALGTGLLLTATPAGCLIAHKRNEELLRESKDKYGQSFDTGRIDGYLPCKWITLG
jgi:hypothetical protein